MGDVVVAKLAGFCFGVSRAVESVEKTIDGRSEIYTLGKLIHNPTFIKKLEEKGVRVIDDSMLDENFRVSGRKAPGDCLHARARGHSGYIREIVRNGGEKQLFQGRRLHLSLRRENTQNRARMPKNAIFCVLGDPDHPEVKGFVSETNAVAVVAPTADELIKKVENLYSDDLKNRRPDSPRRPDHAKAFRVGENSENLQNLLWEFTNL